MGFKKDLRSQISFGDLFFSPKCRGYTSIECSQFNLYIFPLKKLVKINRPSEKSVFFGRPKVGQNTGNKPVLSSFSPKNLTK